MELKTNRLSRLADLLEKYEEGPGTPAFDLGCWTETEIKRSGFLWMQKTECHTHACAVGLACVSGEFEKDGLSYELDDDSIIPVYRSDKEWAAVRRFFGLNDAQSGHLFDPDCYDGPIEGANAAKAVAARIRKLIQPKPKRVRRNKHTTSVVEKIKADALAGAE